MGNPAIPIVLNRSNSALRGNAMKNSNGRYYRASGPPEVLMVRQVAHCRQA